MHLFHIIFTQKPLEIDTVLTLLLCEPLSGITENKRASMTVLLLFFSLTGQ
jgi:hypothetical protein